MVWPEPEPRSDYGVGLVHAEVYSVLSAVIRIPVPDVEEPSTAGIRQLILDVISSEFIESLLYQ